VFGETPRRGGIHQRRRIGYLPGDFVIDDRQTVAAALSGLAALRGGVDSRQVTELADRFDLDLGRRVRELSKGNRQKVGLVQAFMHRPELLILDEPTAGLDPLLRREFVSLLGEVRAEGRTVFISSHILSEVQATADRVGMIRNGRLVAVDSVASLRQRAVRRVLITFADQIRPIEFESVPNLADVSVSPDGDSWQLRAHLTGPADALVKVSAGHTVCEPCWSKNRTSKRSS